MNFPSLSNSTVSKTPTAKSKSGRFTWLLIGLIAGVGFGWWRVAPPPSVGGGRPDSFVATWVKNRIYATILPREEAPFERLTADNAGSWQNVFAEPIQSFEWYQGQNPTRPTSQRKVLVLQPLGAMNVKEQKLLRDLKEYGEAFFQLPVRIATPLSLDGAKSWKRGRQYDSSKIISQVLLPRLPADAAAYLGITMADLRADGLNYVFGQGSFEQRVGVYSLGRYFPAFWGKKENAQSVRIGLRRSCQVLNHEAGHMFGLMHCVLYKCSMNGSNSLDDADAAPLDYCPVCRKKLLWNIGCDAAKRDGDLRKFYRAHNLRE